MTVLEHRAEEGRTIDLERESEQIRVGAVTAGHEREQWDELASRSPLAHMHQCLWWAEPLAAFNVTTRVLGCWKGQELIGGALFRSFAVPLLKLSILECSNGPIFREWQPAFADAFLAGVRRLAREARSVAVFFRGCPNPDVHRDLLRAFGAGDPRVHLAPGSVEGVLDLRDRSLDGLRKNFRKGTKWSIKKALTGPIRVERLTTSEQLRGAYETWMATARRKSFLDVRPWPALEPVLRHSVNNGLGCVLGTFLEEKLLASAFVTYVGEKASFVYGGYADGAERYQPTHILQLMALQESLARGMRFYTFGNLISHGMNRQSGVDQFKLGFGAVPRQNLDTITWERRPLLVRGMKWFRGHKLGSRLEKLLRARFSREQ